MKPYAAEIIDGRKGSLKSKNLDRHCGKKTTLSSFNAAFTNDDS